VFYLDTEDVLELYTLHVGRSEALERLLGTLRDAPDRAPDAGDELPT
jgi:hypothetical protein